MHDEAGFLAAIRHTPADDVARLVFADWLDEQDEPICRTKSQLIRLELRMADERKNRLVALWHLRLIAARLDPLWLAVVSRPALNGCHEQHQLECPGRWDRLTPTDDPRVRRCESCRRNARYCDTLTEALNHAARGTPFALTLAESLENWRLHPPPQVPPPRFLAPPRARRPLPLVPPSQPAERVPEPIAPPPNADRRKKRERGRGRNRNIQRDDWEVEA
jgi:uncharacterized protein (TIGR02996 family)